MKVEKRYKLPPPTNYRNNVKITNNPDLLINSISMVIIEVLDPLLKTGVLQALVNGVGEELYVGVKGKLVHGVDASHVIHHKEEDGSPLSTRTISLEERRKERGRDRRGKKEVQK